VRQDHAQEITHTDNLTARGLSTKLGSEPRLKFDSRAQIQSSIRRTGIQEPISSLTTARAYDDTASLTTSCACTRTPRWASLTSSLETISACQLLMVGSYRHRTDQGQAAVQIGMSERRLEPRLTIEDRATVSLCLLYQLGQEFSSGWMKILPLQLHFS
jgi:hypothetical protein